MIKIRVITSEGNERRSRRLQFPGDLNQLIVRLSQGGFLQFASLNGQAIWISSRFIISVEPV